LGEAHFGGLLLVQERDDSGFDGQPWRGLLGTCLLGASLAWSAAAQAGGDPNAVETGGVLLPRAGEATTVIIEGPAATPAATAAPRPAADVPDGDSVVVVSSEGTQIYSLSDYQALQATGGQPLAAEPATAESEPPATTPTTIPATTTVEAATSSGAVVSEPAAMPVAPAAPTVERAPAPEAPVQSAAKETDDDGLGGFLSEVRIGVLAHDIGAFGRNKEEGPDVNAELLFVSPAFLELVFSPRPHLGMTVNAGDDTSQVYAGLTWDWTFWEPFFVEGSLGFAVHDGEIDIESRQKKALGCRLLFRESLALGARFYEHHSISMALAHISNAKLCEHNEGLDTFGVRYGYKF
jgi:lipid A 3-O-deacylase